LKREQFNELLDKYLAGEASIEEEQRLLNFYESFRNSSVTDNLKDENKLGDKMLNKLMQTVEDVEIHQMPRKILTWKTISIAAAIMIAATTAIQLYISQPAVEEQQFTEINGKNDIAPGHNKAILTLADGSTISLDDAANGLLASQGNTAITKTEDGQIVYQKNIEGKKLQDNHLASNTIQTPKGGKYKVTLPDGSKVWLNSATTLSYPAAFNGTERKVKLKGEAYFEIAHNKKVPFRIESNNQVVEVLGTHFNINSYEDEDYVKTTLLQGSVKIMLNSSKMEAPKSELLKPGEQSLTNSTQSNIRIESTDTEKAIAWKNGYFKFKDTPITEIMREIERWYDVELVYEGKIPTDEFTGYVSNSVKISKVLKIMEQSGGVKFTVKGKRVKIQTIHYNQN
jgi:transmembrane sensor